MSISLSPPLKKQKIEPDPIHVVLDIDGVLTTTGISDANRIGFFYNKGAILTAIKTHYIFPGVIEFLRLLLQSRTVQVSFFSSAVKERNIRFVEQIVQKAVGKDEYEKIKGDIRILSRDDLTLNSSRDPIETYRKNSEHEEQYETYEMQIGEYSKDLRKVLKNKKSLENVVLVDDEASYAAYEQVENLLYVPETTDDEYQTFEYESKKNSLDGYNPIRCAFDNPDAEDEILLIREKGEFKIRYLDPVSNRHKQIHINDVRLIQALSECESPVWIEDPSITNQIYALVESEKGKIRHLWCRGVNRIYYITGLLFTAMERAKEEKTSITKQLFKLQFTPKSPTTYRPLFYDVSKQDHFYEVGLQILRQVNKDLEFTTPKTYKTHLSEEESRMAKKYLEVDENESEECVIS